MPVLAFLINFTFRFSNLWWPNSLADAIQWEHKHYKNKHVVGTVILLFAQCLLYLCYLHNWMQCVYGSSLLLQRHARKGFAAENPATPGFFFVIKRTQLKATRAQLLKKLRLIAFAKICRFLTIQLLVRVSRNLAKNSLETMWMIYHKKSEFWHKEFLIIQGFWYFAQS